MCDKRILKHDNLIAVIPEEEKKQRKRVRLEYDWSILSNRHFWLYCIPKFSYDSLREDKRELSTLRYKNHCIRNNNLGNAK